MADSDDIQNDVLDEGDLASAYQMRENELALSRVRAAGAPQTHPDFDGESCIDCGETIPANRLQLGKIRCVHCQTILERRGKLFASPDA